MKRIIYSLACVMLTTVLMIGCGSKTTNVENTKDTQSTQTKDTSNEKNDIKKVDLEGEVTSISGSKITLKVIKTPEAPVGESQGAPPAVDSSKGSDKPSQNNSKDGQDSKPPEDMKIEYTGETKDITVSDGIQIKNMNIGQQSEETKDITVKDIKIGDVLQITYSDKDKGTISTINVMQSTSKK